MNVTAAEEPRAGVASRRDTTAPDSAAAALALPLPRLPSPLTRLVGRGQELASLEQLQPTTRLLTLKGAGGSGKTRLAVELARRVCARFEGGAVWIELATLADPELLPQQVAAGLGVREQPERSAIEAAVGVLSLRPVLLVLDNCEHLVESCARVVERILRECPGVSVLATSREPLGVPGEIAWTVPPLALPDPRSATTAAEIAASSEAVQLFVERAHAALPSFDLHDRNARAVAQICRQLDGIPLAIELAAARIPVLSPEQIANRLDAGLQLLTSGPRTAASRHRTLRATIDWSHALLSDRERLLFARLAVFAGGFSLEAVEEVCTDVHVDRDEVLDLLAALADRSLIALEEYGSAVRYRLLEPIRQYALERVRQRGGEPALRRRHAEHYRALAVDAEPYLMVADSGWIGRIADDYPNFRSALAWSFGTGGDPDTGVAIAAVLRWYWYYAIRWVEGQGWLEKALAATAARPDTRERAGILRVSGAIAWYQGDFPVALERLEESEVLWRAFDDPRQLAFTLSSLAQLLGSERPGQAPSDRERDLDRAHRLAAEALRLARDGGVLHDIGYVLTNSIAFLAFTRGDYAVADAALAEAERIWRAHGDPRGITLVLTGRARIALRRGELQRAEELVRDALSPRGDMPDEWFGSRSLRTLAHVALARGAVEDAVALFSASSTLLERIGAAPARHERLEFEQALAAARTRLSDAAFTDAWAAGARLTLRAALERLSRAAAAAHPANPAAVVAVPAVALASVPGTVPAEPTSEAAAVLRVNALGPLQIIRDGSELEADAWGPAKPRELLLFLLCNPDGCAKDQIGLALWPDASPGQVRNNFHTALHRLRRTLGEGEWISFANDRYRIDPNLRYEFDAARFERQATSALRELRTGGRDIAALRRALQLYRGHFLDGEVVGDWHLQIRDRLQRLHREALHAEAEYWFGEGDYVEAASVYRQIVYHDDLDEEAYRRLMRCYAQLGERTQALRLYHRLVELLRLELDTEPEPETVELFQSLQRGVTTSGPP